MKQAYLDELEKLVKFPYVEKKYLQEIKKFLLTNENVTKPDPFPSFKVKTEKLQYLPRMIIVIGYIILYFYK